MRPHWTDVHRGSVEARDVGQQLVLGVVRQLVGLGDGQARVGGDVGFGAQPVADPAQPQLADPLDAVDGAEGVGGAVDQRRVDGVHEPGADLGECRAQHAENGHGDDQADHRVGPAPANGNSAGAQQHGQAGEAVGAGVQAVGYQRGGADPAADPNAVAGHQLVAEKADQAGAGDGPQVGDVARMQQPVDGLIGGQTSRQRDHGDDEQTGQVFGAAVAVGVALIRRPAGQRESHQQRYGRQGVGQVVEGVAEQGHRAGQQHHDRLQGGSQTETDQADQ